MPLKRHNAEGAQTGATTEPKHDAANEAQSFRENADVNAKIDAYIEKNPKEWSYIQSMPRARIERSLVLQAVQKEERREKLRESVMKKLDANPEMKEAYRTLVKNLPEEQQEKAMVSLAMRTSKTVAPPAPKQAQGAKV
jgi:hypothetical protein